MFEPRSELLRTSEFNNEKRSMSTLICEVGQNAPPACLFAENPNRLVSLWDMLQRYSFSFYEVVCRLERHYTRAQIQFSGSYPAKIYGPEREELSQALSEMRKECDSLNLDHTVGLVSHIEDEVLRRGEGYTHNEAVAALDTLRFSFSAELRKRFFFRIQEENGKYFQKDDLFGISVNTAFPSSISEIRDAGNGYALEQDEAAAFHSMRVLERGLAVLAKKFGVDFSHTNWHNVIEEVEKKIRKMDSTFGTDWKEQQKFCSQAATHFMFLKDAWRNHVMHVRDVPYDPGRAFSVFGHVREFMQALAEGGLKE